ncbi:S-adenosyl-L-methionine-dependent methyltransferase [Trinorchestia longiramus]|nr:S-adenosyl-L-methionine-dependent methyltransferase [Trinorchestia longiramus]
MSLLPKHSKEFGSKDYWNSFFAGRGTDPFEWYGQYSDLCGLLHTYIRPADRLLVAGCGNSTLGADLYSLGYKNITNVDVSEVVVRQMRARYQDSCPDMVWCHDDLTASSFCSDAFTCVLDKGTLDAIFTDDSQDVVETVNKYLSVRLLSRSGYFMTSLVANQLMLVILFVLAYLMEVLRLLRVGGRYVCVSLLQEHILHHLLQWSKENGCIMRLCRCVEAEQSTRKKGKFTLPVFVVVCTKLRPMSGVVPVLESCLMGDSGQQAVRVSPGALEEQVKSLQQYSAVTHSLLTKVCAGEEARLELCHASTGQLRYVLYILDAPLSTTPALLMGVFIVPQRRKYQFFSQIISLYNNEQIFGFMNLWHILVSYEKFISSAPVHNSKAQTNKKKKGKQKEHQCQGSASPSLDHSYLSCQHHLAMVGSLGLVGCRGRGLLLGLGGGPLATYIHQHFPKISLDAVELDEAMVKVAKLYFGFKTSPRLTVFVQDGLDYCAEKANEDAAYDFILLDVDSKDVSVGMSCPPQSFVTPGFLRVMAACLRPGGVAVLNVVCRDSVVWEECTGRIKTVFGRVLCQNVPQEVNRLLFCIKSQQEAEPESILMESFPDMESNPVTSTAPYLGQLIPSGITAAVPAIY